MPHFFQNQNSPPKAEKLRDDFFEKKQEQNPWENCRFENSKWP